MPDIQLKSVQDYIELFQSQYRNTVKWITKNVKDIYFDDWDYIIQYELRKQFVRETQIDYFTLMTKELNLMKRAVNEISNVYREPAQRRAVTGEKKEGDKTEEIKDENYEELMKTAQIDTVMKMVNRMTNLANHTIVRPIWRDEKIDYDIHMFDNAEILTDPEDWKKIIAVKYYVGLQLPFYDAFSSEKSGSTAYMNDYTLPQNSILSPWEEYMYSYLWTLEDKDENTGKYKQSYIYKLQRKGKGKEEVIEKEENPYRDQEGYSILPFVLFSKMYPIDRLLNFSSGGDLLDLTLNTAINLIHYNALIKYTAWKQKYIITDDVDSIPSKLTLSPQEIAVMPKPKDGSVETGIWDHESDLEKFWQSLVDRVITGLAQYGLDSEAFQRKGQAESGFKLKIKKQGLMERREDQLALYRDYERQLFEKTRIVNNYHNTDTINEKAEFKIDFGEIQFTSQEMEEANVWSIKIRNNVATPIDWIQDDNKDLDDDEAAAMFEKNKAVNGQNVGNIPINPLQKPGGNNALQKEKEKQGNQTQINGNRQGNNK